MKLVNHIFCTKTHKNKYCIIMLMKKNEHKRIVSCSLEQAANERPFTDAIPLLLHTGTFACWVSPLGRFIPP